MRGAGTVLIAIGVLGLLGSFIGLFTSDEPPTPVEAVGITGFLIAFVVVGYLLRRGGVRPERK